MVTIDLSFDDEDEEDDDVVIAPISTVRIFQLGPPFSKPSMRAVSKYSGHDKKSGKAKVKNWVTNPAKRQLADFKATVVKQSKLQTKFQLPILKEGPVKVKVYFCRVPPVSNFINKDRTRPKGIIKAVQDGLASVPYVAIKPDTDNCVKFVLDGMSKTVWTDNAQVAQILA
jgi:Holliday junction resolvase RusA-like endonuclease